VSAFLAAARNADFAALLEVLDPEVVLRADAGASERGIASLISGSERVAAAFNGRAQAARLMLVDGVPGLVWMQHGEPQVVFSFTVLGGRVASIELHGDTDYLRDVDLASLKG
jgi:hypothetical protein